MTKIFFINALSLFSISFFLAGCGQKSGEDSTPVVPSRPVPIPTPSPQPTGALKSSVLEEVKPNQYSVRLEWTEAAASAEQWVVQRQDDQMKNEVIATVEESVRQFTDSKVEAGRSYQYHLLLIRKGEQVVHAISSVLIPRDLEINSVTALSEIKGYRRLFLRPDGQIIPTKSPLLISVEKVVAEGGRIGGFSPLLVAPGSPGRDASAVVLRADTAQGKLILEARGEDGSPGLEGKRGETGFRGKKGSPAEVVRTLEFPLPPLPPCHTDYRNYFRCKTPPSSGGQGLYGGMGERGQFGGKGGNSSSILIDIKQITDFTLKIENEPGRGGTGGLGGPGGYGGEGGEAGERDPYCICPAAHAGPAGFMGTPGGNGMPGPTGNRLPVCLKLGGTVTGECDLFSKYL